jgi:hypothetical protein
MFPVAAHARSRYDGFTGSPVRRWRRAVQRRFDVGSKVYSSQYGAGEVLAVEGIGDAEKLTILFDKAGQRQLMPAFAVLEPYVNRELTEPPGVPAGEPRVAAPGRFPTEEVKEALREVLREEMGVPEIKMMDRWRGGTMILRPGREGQKEKEVPLDDFFHKIVMLRDRLRVMEQKLNAHRGLSDADKVDLQQYITRIYGSLTTFNILFAERDDWFVGQKGDDQR